MHPELHMKFPPTFFHVKTAIDTIFFSYSIKITQARILPILKRLVSDHYNLYVDINIKSAIGISMYKIPSYTIIRLKHKGRHTVDNFNNIILNIFLKKKRTTKFRQ